MNNQHQNFYRALALLNSLLIPVFILSLIDQLNLSFLSKFGFVYIVFMIGSLKVYGMSAIGGGILEIISEEEFVFQMRRVHQNAKELWQGFLVIDLIIFLVDFLVLTPFPSLHMYRPICFSWLGGIAAYGLARWAINKKYIRPLGLSVRKVKFGSSFFMVIIAACFLELIVMRVSDMAHFGNFYWQNLTVLLRNYIHVFEFIYCSLYILDSYPEINEKFNRPKELFLINPIGAAVVRSLVFSVFRTYPPFFVVLKALTPKTYKFREFDQVIWHERYYKDNVLVCITCYTSNCYEAYKIAKEFKKRGAKVVMGGPHVTYFPNEALAFCDSVVIGQAEGVWREVVRDYENGGLKSQYRGPVTEDDYSQVHEELMNSPPYIVKDFLVRARRPSASVPRPGRTWNR